MAEYEACILGLRLAIDTGVQEILVLGDSDMSVEFRHIPRIHNEIADALATLESMLHHPDKTYVDPLHIQIRDQHAYCNVVEEELDGEPWFHDVKEYIKSRGKEILFALRGIPHEEGMFQMSSVLSFQDPPG
ncbi:uncharacterized protein [Nicotiana tomentosiformis]|uniref:uncharacterized protein n=1 Tax=Nicotiana tomentosiformis TaxID=4098 RepID=UPI00388CB3F0